MKKEYRAHLLMMTKLIKPFLFILILPVVRAVLQYIEDGNIEGFVKFEFLVFAIIVAIALLRCLFFRIVCDGEIVVNGNSIQILIAMVIYMAVVIVIGVMYAKRANKSDPKTSP